MRKAAILGIMLITGCGVLLAQARKEFSLQPFESVDLDGNIRIYLEYNKSPELIIEAKKDDFIEEYKVEVRNKILWIYHDADIYFGSTPKISVYLRHPGISRLDMDGLVSVYTRDAIKSESLRIKGDGLIRGDIEVNVKQLDIGLDGMGSITVEGRASESNLSVDGMGKIDASELEGRIISSTDGLAKIKTPN